MKKIFKSAFFALAWVGFSAVSGYCLTVLEVMEEMDDTFFVESDITAQVTFTQNKVGQGVKEYESIYYRRDSDDAFLIVMTAPDSEEGNGYLRVDDNMWMYRQNTRTFQHINRDEEIAGTDMSSGDMETKKLTELYEPADGILTETTLGDIDVYKFEISAIDDDVTYPTQIFWVRQDTYLPLKQESYSLSGTLMETAYFLNYTLVDGNYVCVKQLFVDEFEVGNKTIMEIDSISFDDVDDSIFTKAYLENLSK